jgi:hypothetical protein
VSFGLSSLLEVLLVVVSDEEGCPGDVQAGELLLLDGEELEEVEEEALEESDSDP